MHEDLRGTGVGATTVFPGFIADAGMWADGGLDLPPGVKPSKPSGRGGGHRGNREGQAGDQRRATRSSGSAACSPDPPRAPSRSSTATAATNEIAEALAERQAEKR